MTLADLPLYRTSPLHAAHVALGAKMAEFGGWEMPMSYADGTLAEHRACRSAAAVFDVSHLGTVRVTGLDARDVLQVALTNDLGRIGPGRAQYTHLLDEVDASVLDDIIVWQLGEQRFDVMPNASNTARVLEATGGEDVTDTRAILAVQGPEARDRLALVWPDAAGVARFTVAELDWHDLPCVVAGTGYTGEDGIEVAVPAEAAESLWAALLAADVVPAGLGARDLLRLEAGLPLHGHELGPGITPLQAGLGWVVAWDKGPFRGRAALEGERTRGVARRLVGIECEGRRPPRAGYPVQRQGQVVGEVTSGNFSPVLGHGIALAFVAPDLVAGDEVEVGEASPVAGQLVKTPFVRQAPT